MKPFALINNSMISIKRHKKINKIQDTEDHSMTVGYQKIFNELEDQIQENQKLPKLTTGCHCKICVQCIDKQEQQQDYFKSPPDAYKNMFKLLQQLTLLQPKKAPKILGKIKIPTFFFRREPKIQKKVQFDTLNERPKIQNNKSFSTIDGHRSRPWSFLMFQSNQKTGQLEEPKVVVSMMRVMNLLKSKEQKIRKLKELKQQKQIHDFNQKLQTQVVISDQNIHEQIPSYFLSSTLNSSLRENQHKPVSYIVHPINKSDKKEQQINRIKDSEPFCLFRYLNDDIHQETDKYEVFTVKKLQNFVRNIAQKFKEQKIFLNLPIKCIQSYTRTKVNPVFEKKVIEGIFAMLNIKPKKKKFEKIPVIYCIDYTENSKKNEQCYIFNLSKLQVLLKTNTISKLNPQYIDQFQLDFRLRDLLGDQNPKSQKQFRILAAYKSYKIVNVLRFACNIVVKKIRFKWLLSESDELVLIQCPEYQFDVARSLMEPINRTKNNSKIISDGLSMLQEGFQLPDENTQCESFMSLQQSLLNMIGNKKKKPKVNRKKLDSLKKKASLMKQSKRKSPSPSLKAKSYLDSVSKSIDVKIHQQFNSKTHAKKLNASELQSFHTKKSYNFASTKNTLGHQQDKILGNVCDLEDMKMPQKFPILSASMLCKNGVRNSKQINRYRLRAFKTEESQKYNTFKSENIQMPE